ncbi:MAG: type IV secretion system protein [Erythrobacter sp.]|nr:type IV secretion system protein [Erythrobacter sp.]
MACPAIITGDRFVTRFLTHIDCQAQVIGSYGWQALGEPGSPAANLIAGLLTLFIALFGFRLLFGPAPGARDVVTDVLKIGIVLTLAFSWPAFRTLVHDVVLLGPAEVAAGMVAPVAPDEGRAFVQQLQFVDDAMVRLTEAGTGRNVGEFVDSEAPGGTFRGNAINDDTGFGWARLAWLSGLIGSLALLRIAAGLLLAAAPLAAGFLLFDATRGLFAGWMRGLVLALIGAVGVTLVLAVELSVLVPWLEDALRVRSLGYAIPSAPTELLAMSLGFAIVQFAMIWLLARVAFMRGWLTLPAMQPPARHSIPASSRSEPPERPVFAEMRAQRIVDHMETQLRREETYEQRRFSGPAVAMAGAPATSSPSAPVPEVSRLGSSWKRTSARTSRSAMRRDSGT